MEQRRFLIFLVLSVGILMVWNAFMVPKIPPPKPAAEQQAADGKPADENAPAADQEKADVAAVPDDHEEKATGGDSKDAKIAAADGTDDKAADLSQEDKGEFIPQPRTSVILGSEDPASGYFLTVQLNTQGAAIDSLRLNDPRYRDLDDRGKPLELLSAVPYEKTVLRTFDLQSETFDEALKAFDTDLLQMDWQLESTHNDPDLPEVVNKAVFAARHPKSKLVLRKAYTVEKVPLEGRNPEVVQDVSTAGFLVKLDISIENLGEEPRELFYTLQGPVGLPLENADNTRKYRDIRAGIVDDGSIEAKSLTASAVADDVEDGQVEEWLRPFHYVGVDVQYFAALVDPLNDPLKDRYFEKVTPQLVYRAPAVEQSDLSFKLTSDNLTVKPNETLTHQLQLYAGPKREDLLAPLGAADILDFGMFGFVSKIMVWLLNTLHHNLYIPYGIAIIFLTVIVRGMMYPLSIKQAANAQRMKELQPKLAEIKRKHGTDREKATRAQMELFAEHNYNPLSGCLPIFVQLPIFIGLYAALNSSVDLRMASFLWIDNLAAPDAMFPLPFKVPIVGWTDFNLLPIITIILFIFQQKMFMPPPTDKDQELQFKMMNYMMIFMGFLFYRVPAGLCVYFIASSLWGMGERKLLDRRKLNAKPSTGPTANVKKKGGGFWHRILAAADSAAQGGAGGSSRQKAD
ncbi:MAG: YidC/Oxa1 family insertase periplasmic-domain containing protein [Planctomycetaceae bacterium]